MPFTKNPSGIQTCKRILKDGKVKEYKYPWKRYYKGYQRKNKEDCGKAGRPIIHKNGYKEFRSDKIKCECGSIVSNGALKRHMKSKKHQKNTIFNINYPNISDMNDNEFLEYFSEN